MKNPYSYSYGPGYTHTNRDNDKAPRHPDVTSWLGRPVDMLWDWEQNKAQPRRYNWPCVIVHHDCVDVLRDALEAMK